uniref:Uncharacterized protein n=1 Tax=Angiostrongylus cantonensis TaxID=6313 RepID=A0A0K0DFY2_ANGCA
MKLRALQQKPEPLGVEIVGILLISLVFLTLPSVGVGLAKAIGFYVFNASGPFYIAGLFCSGKFRLVRNSEIVLLK